MKLNLIQLIFTSSFIFFTSCEKSESVQEVFPYYPSEGRYMECTVDGNYWRACGFFPVQSLEITHHYIPEDPEYGKLLLKGNRFDACESNIDYDYTSIMSLRFREGAITNELKSIDLKDHLSFERAYFTHWGDDPENNFEDYHFTYDKLIDGELKIDSLLLPDAEKELYGKIWCSYWMDLSLAEFILDQGIPQDTIHIRDGKFNLTTWWD